MDIKKCCSCKKSKRVEDFGQYRKSTDGLNSRCKKCKREYDNKYYHSKSLKNKQKKQAIQTERLRLHKQFIMNFLSKNPCRHCGENRIVTLEFHHVRDKDFNICDGLRRGYSLERIKKELNKCIVLCANCHRIETSKKLGWFKYSNE